MRYIEGIPKVDIYEQQKTRQDRSLCEMGQKINPGV